jgi:hypothetical protein
MDKVYMDKVYSFLIGCQTFTHLPRKQEWEILYDQFRQGIYDFLLKIDPDLYYVQKEQSRVYLRDTSKEQGYATFSTKYSNIPTGDTPKFFIVSGNNHVYFFMLIRRPDTKELLYIEFDPSGAQNNNYSELVSIFPKTLEYSAPDKETGYKYVMIKETDKKKKERINKYFYNEHDYQSVTNDYCCSMYAVLSYYLAKSIVTQNGNIGIFLTFLSEGFSIGELNKLLQEFLLEISISIPRESLLQKAIGDINEFQQSGGKKIKKNKTRNKTKNRKPKTRKK